MSHNVRAVFEVPDMRCGGCANNIRSVLSRREGVCAVEADAATKRVRVDYDPARTSGAAIADTLATLGYPATAAGEAKEERP